MSDFQIDSEQSGTGTVIKLAGELDGATARSVLDSFERAAANADAGLVIDLSAVTFIDSAGLRAIIMIQQRADERGLPLSVVAPPAPLLELLDVTGLTERLNLDAEVTRSVQEERFLERVDIELPPEPGSPRRARAEVRRAIEGVATEMELSAALLLTSELTTNAVIHPDAAAEGPIELKITVYPERIRVEVTDGGSGFDPTVLPQRPPEDGGRGLLVVDRLASRWGTRREPEHRFTVWYELATGAGGSSAVADAGVG